MLRYQKPMFDKQIQVGFFVEPELLLEKAGILRNGPVELARKQPNED
jgi:hypothetical protein